MRITTGELNRFVESLHFEERKIFYATQPGVSPPLFVFVCTDPDAVPSHYKRFLENVLRQEFDFEGVPLTLEFRPRRSGEQDDE